VDPHPPRRKEMNIQYVRRSRHAAAQAISLVASGRLDVRSWVTHRFPIDRGVEAFETVEHYRDGVLKAVIVP
jgi:L-iditol 2-dehydrogenase